MDIENAVPFVQEHRCHPVFGSVLSLNDLHRLTFHKNAKGEYHCPVLHKVFTKNTPIVAIRTTGNVYSKEVRLLFAWPLFILLFFFWFFCFWLPLWYSERLPNFFIPSAEGG